MNGLNDLSGAFQSNLSESLRSPPHDYMHLILPLCHRFTINLTDSALAQIPYNSHEYTEVFNIPHHHPSLN